MFSYEFYKTFDNTTTASEYFLIFTTKSSD